MKKTVAARVSDVLGLLSKKAPLDLAESWDNVGLLIGDARATVTGIVVCVNLGFESIAEAKKKSANLIICHHPPIFKPISRITAQTSPWAFEALKAGIAVIALHTNFDLSSTELNKDIAKHFKAEFKGPLNNSNRSKLAGSMKLAKFVTYIPKANAKDMREALSKAGAGSIGRYSECTFMVEGIGTFKGDETTNPTVGKPGRLEEAEEVRLETIFPLRLMDKVVEAAKQAHPYEEMAYDILPLENPLRSTGYGFIGEFKPKIAFSKLLKNVKQVFQLDAVMSVSGPALDQPDLEIQRIAFSPGSGSAFVSDAIAKGVDVYICGEVGYHQILEARTAGLSVLTIGHSNSELFFVKTVSRWVQETELNVSEVFEHIHDVR